MKTQDDDFAENLSVPPLMLIHMNNQQLEDTTSISNIFGDPVGYLAQFGIDAELIAETTMPVAA